VYAWARELIGPRYGWFTGWAYMWGLTLVLSALSLAAAQFLLGAFGADAPSYWTLVLTALAVLLFGSAANMIGSRLLKTLLYISMTCELVASLGIGVALLFFHRTHPFSVLFTSGGTGHGAHWLFSSFFGVVAFIGFSFLGFESAGSIAEEVRESRRVLPKAITLSLLAAGLLVMFASLGIVLSVPDIAAVVSGQDANPIATTLETRLGSATGKALLIMLTVGFTASLIGVQAAVTRAIWASARDKVLPAARWLGRLSGREHLPRYAIGLTTVIAGALLFISSSKIYALLLSFGNAGFYISYALPVVGAAYLRWRGRWTPGDFSMGRWSNPATYIAAVWITLEAINIAWPRPVFGVWYLNWGLLIMTGILGVLGVLVCARVLRPGSPGAEAAAQRSADRVS
jgi:amino acid transporter